MTDEEMAAALWVSDEGEIRCEPEWVTGLVPWWAGPVGWERLPASGPVAAGIVRLLRERDAAMEACRWHQAMEAQAFWQKDEAQAAAREILAASLVDLPRSIAENIRSKWEEKFPFLVEDLPK